MNRDQITGWIKEVRGAVKTSAGQFIGNESLIAKGQIETAAGRMQSAYGELKSAIARNF